MYSRTKPKFETPTGIFSKNPNITFHVVTDTLRKNAFECECLSFGKSNFVIHQIYDIDDKEHYKMFGDFLSLPDNHLVSTCAVDNRTNRVVSGMRNEPYPSDGIHLYPTLPDGSTYPIFDFVSVLDAEWPSVFAQVDLQPNEKEFLYFFTGYTDPQYFNQGIFSEMYSFTEQVAKSKGFKYIFALAVSKAMQQVLTRKHGFVNLFDWKYSEVEVNGQFPARKFIDERPHYESESVMYVLKSI